MKRIWIFSLFLLIVSLAGFLYSISGQAMRAQSGNNVQGISVNAQTNECDPTDTQNWCQVARLPQRTSSTPEVIVFPNPAHPQLAISWTHSFQPDTVHPQVQAIVYRGKVFIPTEGANSAITRHAGRVYAFDISDGREQWHYDTNSSLIASVAAGDGKIFFGDMDGVFYALDADTTDPKLLWKEQFSGNPERFSFSSAPLIADGKVIIGGRNGKLYVINTDKTYPLNWQATGLDLGSPILQTPAYDQGKLFVGTMDKKLHVIDISTGVEVWTSNKLQGRVIKDYWPIIVNGYVLLRTDPTNVQAKIGITPNTPFIWRSDLTWLDTIDQTTGQTYGELAAQGNASTLPDFISAQQTILQQYNQNTNGYEKNLFVFNTNTYAEITVPHWTSQTMHNTPPPPCIDRDDYLIMPVIFMRSGWGRMDINQKQIVDILFDDTFTALSPSGMGNRDESTHVTCTNNLIISTHIWEAGGSGYTGFFDLTMRKWHALPPGQTNQQMSANTQSGGGNPVSVASGKVFHIVWNELIVREPK